MISAAESALVRRNVPMAGQGLADIGEALAHPQLRRANSRTERQHRHILARMIRAGPGWIAAMVRRDDRQISGAQQGLEARQHGVEGLERGSVAGDIAAVAIERVEIDEIG